MKRFVLYVVGLVVFGLCISLALEYGRNLPAPRQNSAVAPAVVASAVPAGAAPSPSFWLNLQENFKEPLTRLFVQLIVIVLVARLCGAIATKLRQPSVIGEMIAGILLGPSLLGWLWPHLFDFVFSPSSLGTLRLLSQIGVCLFMFLVGMELDLGHLKQQARTAFVVSQISIFFPYMLGVVASLFLFSEFAGPRTTFPAFALFVGISMSITAFPVLARILEERNLTKTALGTTALVCAATNDVMAWSILAVVVAIAKATGIASTLFSIGLVIVFVLVMLFVMRPFIVYLTGLFFARDGSSDKAVMAIVLPLLFASALATDVMGMHALFGAFLAGVIMPPRADLRENLKLRIENITSVFLLPLFFAFTGLRTQLGLLDDTSGWLICAGLIGLATIGKLGGTMLTARLTGVNWADSFALGALMNTRGLVELIALNIGYDLGILSPRIFTMLVIMALTTTAMTGGPLLSVGEYVRTRKALSPDQREEIKN